MAMGGGGKSGTQSGRRESKKQLVRPKVKKKEHFTYLEIKGEDGRDEVVRLKKGFRVAPPVDLTKRGQARPQ